MTMFLLLILIPHSVHLQSLWRVGASPSAPLFNYEFPKIVVRKYNIYGIWLTLRRFLRDIMTQFLLHLGLSLRFGLNLDNQLLIDV